MFTLSLPKWLNYWNKDIVDIPSRGYSPLIVLIPENSLALFSSQNAAPNHHDILLDELWEEAISMKLMPRALTHSNPA